MKGIETGSPVEIRYQGRNAGIVLIGVVKSVCVGSMGYDIELKTPPYGIKFGVPQEIVYPLQVPICEHDTCVYCGKCHYVGCFKFVRGCEEWILDPHRICGYCHTHFYGIMFAYNEQYQYVHGSCYDKLMEREYPVPSEAEEVVTEERVKNAYAYGDYQEYVRLCGILSQQKGA